MPGTPRPPPPDGLIKENALSWWTTLGSDGPAVEKGGVAEVLSESLDGGATRTVYTYTGTQAALSHSSNAFVTTNTAITNTTLNVANDAARQSLFTSVRTGNFGDIIHSELAVVYYPTASKSIIFVGANDGMLHCHRRRHGPGALELSSRRSTSSRLYRPGGCGPRLLRGRLARDVHRRQPEDLVHRFAARRQQLHRPSTSPITPRRGSSTASGPTPSTRTPATPRTATRTRPGAILGPAGKGDRRHRFDRHNDRVQRDHHGHEGGCLPGRRRVRQQPGPGDAHRNRPEREGHVRRERHHRGGRGAP